MEDTTSATLISHLHDARKRAEMFAEQARKMKMEEEDKIRQLEDKWSKSYEEKSIVADQLERELTTTVIALDEIKIDRERTEKSVLEAIESSQASILDKIEKVTMDQNELREGIRSLRSEFAEMKEVLSSVYSTVLLLHSESEESRQSQRVHAEEVQKERSVHQEEYQTLRALVEQLQHQLAVVNSQNNRVSDQLTTLMLARRSSPVALEVHPAVPPPPPVAYPPHRGIMDDSIASVTSSRPSTPLDGSIADPVETPKDIMVPEDAEKEPIPPFQKTPPVSKAKRPTATTRRPADPVHPTKPLPRGTSQKRTGTTKKAPLKGESTQLTTKQRTFSMSPRVVRIQNSASKTAVTPPLPPKLTKHGPISVPTAPKLQRL